MYLSYSGYHTFRECPRVYFHRYINKSELPEPDNRVNMLYGSAVGVVFERFYNDKIWRQSNTEAALQAIVEPVISEIIAKERSKGGVFDWKAPKLKIKSLEQLTKEVRVAIPKGLATIRLHRLIGHDAAAEVKLDGKFQGHILGGSADFAMHRVEPYKDKIILDGKGSRYREQYVDAAQLHWYAMLHRAKLGVPPDRLGFVFWRQDSERALDWVPFTPADLDHILIDALAAVREIERCATSWSEAKDTPEEMARLQELFPANPSGQCKLCSYKFACPFGTSMKPTRVQPADLGGVGVEDVGFDD